MGSPLCIYYHSCVTGYSEQGTAVCMFEKEGSVGEGLRGVKGRSEGGIERSEGEE